MPSLNSPLPSLISPRPSLISPRRSLITIAACVALAGCVSASPPPTYSRPAPRPASQTPPPQLPRSTAAPSTTPFIAPNIMRKPGLERVIGSSADELERLFGQPRLDTPEGDMRKLQFSGTPCVLDIYLYPLRPGAQPAATHVEARRASDGRPVDQAACVRALSKR